MILFSNQSFYFILFIYVKIDGTIYSYLPLYMKNKKQELMQL